MLPELSPTTPSSSSRSANRQNLLIFVLLSVIAVAGVIAYVLYSRDHVQPPLQASAQPTVPDDGRQLVEVRKHPHILFRNTALGPSYGLLCIASLNAPDGERYATALRCERVYATSEAGLCLQAHRSALTTYEAVSFDRNFAVLHTFNLAGGPSRTRVSRDGRWAAATVFVVGDSYAASGFSTRTTIFDLQHATKIGELEEFRVLKDGQLFKQLDFNFWGVTFAEDGDRFYATLASGGTFYLVEGQIARHELQVLRTGVECPSLSPDGTRLVFKSRMSEIGRRLWRLHVLDLRTLAETIINEANSVDDQAAWLDSDHVLYALPRNIPGSGTSDVWVARADGDGTPRVFMHNAASPCLVRP